MNLKQKGIGLLELMLSLAIIAILLVMATRYYGAASKSEKVDDTIQLISEISVGVNSLSAAGKAPANITVNELYNNGYLADKRVSTDYKKIKNPWDPATDIDFEATAGTGDIKTLKFTSVADKQCSDLAIKLAPDATCATNTLTVHIK